jgi:adenosylcobinamide-phosphate synthase
MIAAAFVLGLDWRGAIRIVRRDGRTHLSPNAGLPEAVAAGAIGVRLGGPSTYNGVLSNKPYIGEARVSPDAASVRSAVRMMYLGGGALAVISAMALVIL